MTVTELQHNNANETTIQLNGPIQQIWEHWSSNSTLIDQAGSPQQKWKAYLLMHRTQPEAWWSSNNPHTRNSALQEKKNQTSHPLEQVIPTQVIQHHRKKRTKHLTSGASDTNTGDSAPKKEKNQTSHPLEQVTRPGLTWDGLMVDFVPSLRNSASSWMAKGQKEQPWC